MIHACCNTLFSIRNDVYLQSVFSNMGNAYDTMLGKTEGTELYIFYCHNYEKNA